MGSVPKRAADRISVAIKRFQPILASAKTRDVNESDTVIIVTDMLAEVFGYDKYSEITSEHAVKSTFCDLAIKLDGAVRVLIEVKAIGLELKDQHVKQAVDYAANLGVDWVALTNGEAWRVYKVTFDKPIDAELVLEFFISKLDHRAESTMETLFMVSREGWQKSALADLQERKQALSRFFLGAILTSDSILDVVRRELKRLSPNVRIENDEIKAVLMQDVLKREVLEGEKAELARKQAAKAANKAIKEREKKRDATTNGMAGAAIVEAESDSQQ